MAYVKCLKVPNGASVTPTDDVSILLMCAGIFHVPITGSSVNEQIANAFSDNAVCEQVCKSHNAVEYMSRCTLYNFQIGILGNANARQYLGADNYSFEKLWGASSTWKSRIVSYDKNTHYMLNVYVPTMTSNTTPSGVCSAYSQRSSTYAAWKAFDNDSSTLYLANNQVAKNASASSWVKYDFESAKRILASTYDGDGNIEVNWMEVAYSDDNVTYTNITEQAAAYTQYWATKDTHRYWRMRTSQKNVSSSTSLWCPRIVYCQILGRENV